MHLGTGEEVIIAGIVPQLRQGDALALDQRGTAAMLMRGLEPALIFARHLEDRVLPNVERIAASVRQVVD